MPSSGPGSAAGARQREEQFDSFYHATRHALLLQTFALTGDLSAAYAAVRDSYAEAWHRWDQVGRLPDPLDRVRPRAWRLAQRRHSSRLWRRRTALSTPGDRVLAAVGRLPMKQRKALLLTRLAGLSPQHAARELGLPATSTAQLRGRASDSLAAVLGTEPRAIRERLLSLGPRTARARLPRASVIRRVGNRRRAVRTLVAAAAAVAVTVGSGALAYQRPDDPPARTEAAQPAPPSAASMPLRRPGTVLSGEDLLDNHQVSRLGGRQQQWRTTRTHDNTTGDGINSACQQERFADPGGVATLVRQFTTGGGPRRSAVQTVEVSRSPARARRAFQTTLGWYAGCQVGRFQLLTAYRVDDLGDEARVLTARVWSKPVTSYSVGVARTGRVVTSTVVRTVGGRAPAARQLTQSLDDSVSLLCARAGSEDCANDPTLAAAPPPPSGERPGILAVVDLPPVGRINRPWVGTDARPARTNPAMTTCDQADFTRVATTRTRTRSFLIPGADVPRRFGLSETYGEFRSRRAAARFLGQVRTRVERCEARNEAATVSPTTRVRSPRRRLEARLWEVETEVSDDASVRFRLGFVRARDKVAQVTFSPARNDDISPRRFRALVVRAGNRLVELR